MAQLSMGCCSLIKSFLKILFLSVIGLIGLAIFRTYNFHLKSVRDRDSEFSTRILEQSKSQFNQLNWDKQEQSNAVSRLARAIQKPTIDYQRDEQLFNELFEQMMKDFPLLFSESEGVLEEITQDIRASEVTEENDFLAAKVWVWRGSDKGKKPVLLTGHVDVVPINDESKWEYPPFSGKQVNGFLYGRGTLDDKNGVYEILEALNQLRREKLLIQPQRDTYIVIGMDEEIGGVHGASKVTSYFLKNNVRFAFVMDEGGQIADKQFPSINSAIAFVAIAEKGYCNFNIEASCDPGHASMPGSTSCIGILSKAIVNIENNPMPAHLQKPIIHNVFLSLAPHSEGYLMKAIIANIDLLAYPLGIALSYLGGPPNAIARTSFAPTILKAGVQSNVMPSKASFNLNTRFSPYDNLQSVMSHLEKVINHPNITITPQMIDYQEASTVSCVDCIEFQVVKKAINHIQPDVIVSPYLFIAGSDSKYYRKLSDFAYGYLPMRLEKKTEDLQRIHGHNERILVQNYLESVTVYSSIILNINQMLSERP